MTTNLRKSTGIGNKALHEEIVNSNLREAVAVIKAGDKETGRRLLLKILDSEPQNEQAWLWLASVVNRERRQYCLERVLEINPQNELAKQQLAKLEGRESTPSSAAKPSNSSNKGCIILLLILMVLFCGFIWQAGGSPTTAPVTDDSNTNSSTLSAEDEYKRFVVNTASEYAAGADALGVVNEQLSQDPTLIFDEEWQNDLVVATVMIRAPSVRVMERVDVPTRYQDFHSEFVRAARLYDESMMLYAEAVDDVDPDKLDRAIGLLRQANRIVEGLPIEDFE